jgi:hypothetical protein
MCEIVILTSQALQENLHQFSQNMPVLGAKGGCPTVNNYQNLFNSKPLL